MLELNTVRQLVLAGIALEALPLLLLDERFSCFVGILFQPLLLLLIVQLFLMLLPGFNCLVRGAVLLTKLGLCRNSRTRRAGRTSFS